MNTATVNIYNGKEVFEGQIPIYASQSIKDIEAHLHGKTHFLCQIQGRKCKVNEYDEGYEYAVNWATMILGVPEIRITTSKSKRVVWSQTQGFSETYNDKK